MAQLSESLVRVAIRGIRENRKLYLTINEVDQALHAWLKLNGYAEEPKYCLHGYSLDELRTGATSCERCSDNGTADSAEAGASHQSLPEPSE